MRPSPRLRLFTVAFLIAPAILFGASKAGPSSPAGLPSTLSAQENYGNLPLAFEPNLGQFDPQVRFLTRSRGMTVFFTDNEAVMVLRKSERTDPGRLRGHEARAKTETAVVRMKLAGARTPVQAAGMEKLPGITNYFIGNDPAKWRTDIPNFARIRYQGVYPGVDLVCYGNQRQVEYDLLVAPGADPNQIELAWEGADRIDLNADGDLVLTTRLGDVIQKRPRVYQEVGGRAVEVGSKYRIISWKRVKFELAKYDRNRPLRIDPTVALAYSTYLGGSGNYTQGGDKGLGIAVDSAGSAYVTGSTYSADFPIQSAYQATLPNVSAQNAFVTKLSPAGNALVYSTYFGASPYGFVDANAIAVDSNGSAYIAGSTGGSGTFPTKSAYQTVCRDGVSCAFVTKFAPAGNALVYSTLLGGSGYTGDDAFGIAVDASNYAYVTGATSSKDFPTHSAFQTTNKNNYNAVFVTKLAVAGNALVYSTYLGGSGDYDSGLGIAVDASGYAYVTGRTTSFDFPLQSAFQTTLKNTYGQAFVTKLAPAGNALVYSTYLGGSGYAGSTSGERGLGIAVDSAGNAYVTGPTNSSDFPTQSAYQKAINGLDNVFVTKFSASGALAYSTYLGGMHIDNGNAIAVDSSGSAYVTGSTTSNNFPTLSAYQTGLKSGTNAFVAKLAPAGNALVYSTYLGGTGGYGDTAYGIAVDGANSAYVTGISETPDFPTKSAFQTTLNYTGGNAFVTKLTFSGSSSPTITITTSPSGLAVTIDGTSYTAPQSFTWTSGSQHTIAVSSPQGSGTRYVFSAWSDGGAASHTITTPSSSTTYTANFNTQYLLTTGVSGTGGISVSPSSTDGYYASGASVQLTASPSSTFAGWSGDASGTSNPVTLTMNAPKSVTATFGAPKLPDLVLTALTAPTKATAGGTMKSISVTVANQGNAASGDFYIGFYFSTSSTISTSAVDTGLYCAESSLAPGASDTCTGDIVVPGTLTNGTWYFGAIADFDNEVTESNENNNSRASDSGPVTISGGVSGLYFYPVTPCRVADTRGNGKTGAFGPPNISGGTNRAFAIPSSGCNIPSTAAAYSLNVTVVPPGQLTYLTMWPTGQSMPVVSTLNDFSTQVSTPGNVVANAAIVPAGTNGSVSVFASDTSDVIIDINGYFAPATSNGLVFYPVTPCRVADTRNSNGTFGGPRMTGSATRSFPIPQSSCNVPSSAQAYSLNMTVVPTGALTYLTSWPSGQSQPTVSTLNDFSTGIPSQAMGKVVANAAIVPAGTNGAVSVFVSDATDVIIDINGYFAPAGGSGALSFYTATPCRLADTRTSGMGATFGAPSMAAGATRTFPLPTSSACSVPSSAKAYSLNMTVVPPQQLIYLTTWPTGQGMPVVSTLNDFSSGTVVPGRVVANAAIVPAGTNGSVNVYVSDLTDVIIDINGYFAP